MRPSGSSMLSASTLCRRELFCGQARGRALAQPAPVWDRAWRAADSRWPEAPDWDLAKAPARLAPAESVLLAPAVAADPRFGSALDVEEPTNLSADLSSPDWPASLQFAPSASPALASFASPGRTRNRQPRADPHGSTSQTRRVIQPARRGRSQSRLLREAQPETPASRAGRGPR